MLDNSDQNSPGDIAIVGMALRVPGASNISEFWQNLCEGRESIRDVSFEELAAAGETAERMHHPNYVRRTAELSGLEMFDADFFGMSPKEAAIMDPQHRFFLECAWEAMEDAGRMPDTADGPVGVFAGCGMGSYFYFNVCSNRQLVDQVGMFLLRHTGNDKDFLSTRASFLFDLRGPSVNVQTACSTSLVATHYACQSLLNGECDMALAGGVTIELPHRRGYLFQEGEILSPDGHCRAFDHRAAGTVFGSGVGIVALRRLSDALEDGDVIHAVIKATAINNDGGTKAGYLAPSVSGQAEAVIEAQGLAGLGADGIHYVECHGTGTPIGDPIEIEALTQAFRRSTDRTGFCRVGSVKTNIGHLDTAAGVVGLIKTALMVKHGEMVPTLNYEKANPAIDFANSPFVVNSTLTPWPPVKGKRRAAVNSLGVGGTNAHAIVEQAPYRAGGGTQADGPVLLTLSAKNQGALDGLAVKLRDRLRADPGIRLDEVAYTLATSRKRFEETRVIAVGDRADALQALMDPKRKAAQPKLDKVSDAVFLFAGGGAQHAGMAKELYAHEPLVRAVIDEGLSFLDAKAAVAIRTAWFGEGDPKGFLKPSVQLPAILILEVAVARLWMASGVRPAALIGHSMGENTAACISGVLSFRDAVRLVRLRGELFDTVEPGGMLSVPLGVDELTAMVPDDLDIASVNAPGLCVVSGSNEALDRFREICLARGIETTRVPIDIAAHSRMLDGILPRWEAFLRSLTLNPPSIPIVSNRSGTWLTAAEATDPLYWVGHLRSTVNFSQGLVTLASQPDRVFIEAGPGRAMSSLAKAQGTIDPARIIPSLPHAEAEDDDRLHFLNALGRAFVAGLPIEQSLVWGKGKPSRVSLPTYAFQHRRFFIEPSVAQVVSSEELSKENDPTRWFYRPAWKRSLADFSSEREAEQHNWLVFLDENGTGARLAGRLREKGNRVVTVALGDAFIRRGAEDYTLCAEMGRSGYDALLAGLAADDLLPTRIAHLWLLTEAERFRPGSNFFHRNQECGFQSLLYLAQALGEVNLMPGLHISVVTNGAQRVGDEAVPYPEKATVFGPALVIPKELAATVKLVDCAIEPAARKKKRWAMERSHAVNSLQAERDSGLWEELLAAPASETVALRGSHRWLRVTEPMQVGATNGSGPCFKAGGTYFITGGLGGVALALSEELATRFTAKLVLVGRTILPTRDEWQAYKRRHGFDAVRRGIAAIENLEAKGSEVLYLSADVSDPQAMTEAVAAALERFGSIQGVLHTAGLVDDGLIATKTEEATERVLAPKLLGTAVLDQVFDTVPLDFMVLFSSTSTDTAPAGQADYVAANAYLNAYAESRAGRADRKTVALHWGIWNEVGLAARATGTAAKALCAVPDEPAKGPFFARWMEDENGVVWLEADLSATGNWMLHEHRLVSGEAVLPGTAYLEAIAQAAREHGLEQASVSDLVFLKALVVADGEARVLRLRFEEEGKGFRVTVVAGAKERPDSFEKHAEAFVHANAKKVQSLDLSLIAARCGNRQVAQGDAALRSAQEDHILFGPRWHNLRTLAVGQNEALAELALDDAFHADLAGGTLAHPALLDIATGFAMDLVAGYRGSKVLWAPASYGATTFHGPLPQAITSWVRLGDASAFGDGFAAFDVTVADKDGTVLFEAQQLLMKRLDHDGALGGVPSRAPAQAPVRETPTPAMLRLAAQVRLGILPTEGFTALEKALGANTLQPIVSSIDLFKLQERAARTADVAAAPVFEQTETDADYAAPRNPTEMKLAAFWQDLLGVARVGIHASFFDLGGHSLIAVRLFRQIKKEWGLDLPISLLFEAPTVAQCAAIVAAQRPEASNADGEATKVAMPFVPRTHLVPMHPGNNREATPLFICAGMFGNVLNLRHLAQRLGADRPVYGLQARGLYGDMAPHESFEEMARDYLAEIRAVRPHGPYLLAGYSGGGITAFEMARQLQNEGEVVEHVIMFDTPQPTQPPLSWRDRASMKAQDLHRYKGAFLRRWLKTQVAWRNGKRAHIEAELAAANPTRFNNERIENAFRRALARYAVVPYRGPLTILRPKQQAFYRLSGGRFLEEGRNILLPDNGWSAYAEALTVREVPGDHDSMVLEPYVRVLASQVRHAIEGTAFDQTPLSPAPASSEASDEIERQLSLV